MALHLMSTLTRDVSSPLRTFPITHSRSWLCASLTSGHLPKSSTSSTWSRLVKCHVHLLPPKPSFLWEALQGRLCLLPPRSNDGPDQEDRYLICFALPYLAAPSIAHCLRLSAVSLTNCCSFPYDTDVFSGL